VGNESTPTVDTRRVVSRSEPLGAIDATDSLPEPAASSARLSELGVVSLELDRGEIPERGVRAPRVVPASMYSKIAVRAAARSLARKRRRHGATRDYGRDQAAILGGTNFADRCRAGGVMVRRISTGGRV
jgi:hypothetical protein